MASFLRRTVMGGLFVLVPIIGATVLLAKVLKLIQGVLAPVVKALPEDLVGGVLIHDAIALAGLVFLCFLFGLTMETALGKRVRHAAEEVVFGKLPGYSFLKRLTENLAGNDETFGRPVLVQFDDNAQFGFLIDEGATSTVFVPGSPAVASGSVIVVKNEQVVPVDAKKQEFLQSLSKWGFNSQRFLAKKEVG